MALRATLLAAAACNQLMLASAQAPAGSAEEDKIALLELKADWQRAGASRLSTWNELFEPCAAGSWHDPWSGWLGVMCDAENGRVSYIQLSDNGLGGEIAAFAQLGALRQLDLSMNVRVRGDVAELVELLGLRSLDLSETSVHGDVASLVGLTGLGEGYTSPYMATEVDAVTGESSRSVAWRRENGGLRLDQTGVYGATDSPHRTHLSAVFVLFRMNSGSCLLTKTMEN